MAIDPSTNYPGQITAPSSGYPYGSARNVTVPGDGTGTPNDFRWLNDFWGFFQQLIESAGLTPDGDPDEVGASQYFDAVRATSGVPGMIVPVVFNATPASLGVRILICDGSVVSVSTYQDLVDNTWVGSVANATAPFLYRASDAGGTTRDASGSYFVIPDMRGRFLRGQGTLDPDYASRSLASNQSHATIWHGHKLSYKSYGTSWQFINNAVWSDVEQVNLASIQSGVTGVYIPRSGGLGVDLNGTAYAAELTDMDNPGSSNPNLLYDQNETRPKNSLVNFGIWY